MKKTRHIQLVLLTAALASCHRNADQQWTSGNQGHNHNGNNVFIRSDSTAPYTRVYHPNGAGGWYFAFRPYGNYYNGRYRRIGYFSDAISEHSNLGTNGAKSGIVRGGFGESAHGGGEEGGGGAHASS
jgi:hypothetical protein